MNADTIKAASEALKPLLDKLGELGAHGWEIAVRQQYVYAISDALLLAFFVCATIALGRIFFLRSNRFDPKRQWEDAYWETAEGMIVVLSLGVVAVTAIVILCAVGGSIAGRFLNPEWYALQSLLALVK